MVGHERHGISKMFRCGERVYARPDGSLTTSYSCSALGAIAMRLEETLAFAKMSAEHITLSNHAITVLEAFVEGADIKSPRKVPFSLALRKMVRLGLIQQTSIPSYYTVTPWGEIVYRAKRKEKLL